MKFNAINSKNKNVFSSKWPANEQKHYFDLKILYGKWNETIAEQKKKKKIGKNLKSFFCLGFAFNFRAANGMDTTGQFASYVCALLKYLVFF